jgi:phosphate/phosphite/phosphonate ABC transporter binding protein
MDSHGNFDVAQTATSKLAPLRIGLIPERDLFEQRKAYQLLALYLQKHLPHTPTVELVTASSYKGILQDIQEGTVDVAFAGSLVAILAADRFDAQVLLKSESDRPGGRPLATYTGVLFVREDSPARSVTDLAGKRVAGVRTTMGGAVFPLYLSGQVPADQLFELVWAGTHEDVIREVVAGNVDAGAVKNTRLDAWELGPAQATIHSDRKFRRLSQGPAAPDNALVVRKDFDPVRRDAVVAALLGLHNDPEGQAVLAALSVRRFLPCTLDEYGALYQMIDALGPRWNALNIEGPAPRHLPDH